MKLSPISIAMLVVSLFLAPALLAQSPDSANQGVASLVPSSAAAAEVPRLIKFSGTLLDAQDRPMAGPVGVTFALHAQQTGGAALWLETQNVTPDAHGLYTVLLGANSANGVPAELFASGEARWLGVQPERQPEQPRILLVSVPYALKAGDAQTLGGLPPSAFAPAGSNAPANSSSTLLLTSPSLAAGANSAAPTTACATVTADGTATVNSNLVAKFISACQIHQSQLFDNGTNVGVGNTSPAAKLDVSGGGIFRGALQLPSTGAANITTKGFNSQPLDLLSSVFNGTAAVSQQFRWQAEPVNPGLSTASGKLNLLFASGAGIPAETGLSISSQGLITFAAGQTLPTVSGNEAVSGNISASQLTSTVATGTPPLSVKSTTQVPNLNASLLGGLSASAFAQLAAANTFTKTQTINANLALPNTNADGSAGVLTLGGAPFLHNFGSANTFVGSSAGNTSMTGTENSAFGFHALVFNTTGGFNAAFGASALQFNTGSSNSAFGAVALHANTTGGGNSAFGESALLSNTTAINNSAFGGSALVSNTTGGSNSAFGRGALQSLASGSGNIAIGTFAGSKLTGAESNNLYIGNVGVAGESGTIRIGNPAVHTAAFLSGNVTLPGTLTMGGLVTFANGQTFAGAGGLGSANTFTAQNTFTAVPTGAGVNQGSLYIDPASAGAGQTLLGAAVGGTQKMLLDSGGTLTLSGNLSLPSTNRAGTAGVILVNGTRFVHNFGSFNTFVGSSAGNTSMTGQADSALGTDALSANTTGGANSAFGTFALVSNTTGSFNSAFGTNALDVNTTGVNNAAFGYNALVANTTAAFNSAFGAHSLQTNTTGTFNSAFGDGALAANTTANNNSAFGLLALGSNTTASSNSAFGFEALTANTTGSPNSAFGAGTLFANTTGSNNAAFGANALNANTIGINNSAFGVGALQNNNDPSNANNAINNSAFGYNALFTNTMGAGNAAFGTNALQANTTGGANAAFGTNALQANTTATDNSAFGTNSLLKNTMGTFNSAFGSGALSANTTAGGNSAFGSSALLANTTGSPNSAFGASALAGNTTGAQNDAFGNSALFSNTMGNNNAAFGFFALHANATGSNNAAFGDSALAASTATNNSAFGVFALSHSTMGGDNVAFGTNALQGLLRGSANIAIGSSAGTNLSGAESHDIYLGHPGAAGESKTIRIGDGSTQTAAFITGISGVNVSGSAVMVNGNGQLGVMVSSRRFKEEIADMSGESDVLMKLRPVAFFYKPELDDTHIRQYGLVAEEVAQVAPQLVVFDKHGVPQTVRYHFVNAMLLNEVQKQRQLVEEQQSTIARQQAEIQDLAARLAKLEALAAPAP
jgi:hypothetical protein